MAYLDVTKIFAKVPYLFVKINEKHDADVAEAVKPTVLELCSNFVQKWGPK